MKKIASLCITMAFLGFLFVGISTADAAVRVKGYFRKDGTYVQPYYRSNPDGNPYNNWSFPGNTNPYTGETATGNPDTYLKNYYNGSSGSTTKSYFPSLYNSTVSSPKKDVSYVTKLWVTNNPTTPCEQSTFLRLKERAECSTYKLLMNNYTWNVTTNEFNGKHYIYNPTTKITSSCSDGYYFNYDTTGSPMCYPEQNVIQSLPAGCTTTIGYSPTTGIRCDLGATNATLPAGCTSTVGYSPTTGIRCDLGATSATLPAGCTSITGYSVTTGQPCSNN